MTYYPPRSNILQNFSPIVQTVYEICVTKVFSTFWLRGANPWAKVHQKGRWPGGLRDLPSCKISSPYVNPCPRYPLPCYQRPADKEKKNKQTVNDISPACLSACGDNKYASYSDWRISPHPDPPGCIPVNCLQDVHYQHFLLFGLEANPWVKVHQSRRWPATHQVYHPAKFYRPASTHVGDIHYKNLRTNKQRNKQ